MNTQPATGAGSLDALADVSAAVESGAGLPEVARATGRALNASVAVVDSSSSVLAVACASPDDEPGQVVSRSLADFRRALEGRKTRLTPWLQDFSLGRTYALLDVQEQIAAARAHGTQGFLLWNPLGVYTPGALAP